MLFFKYTKGIVNNSVADAVSSNYDSDGTACCSIGGDQSFLVFAEALGNVSSNIAINITTNVELSSFVLLNDTENVTIIGHENPTVNCNGIGALKFVSCDNISIEGINWENCGSNSETETVSAIEFYNSSKITVQNCSFQQSRCQAITLSKVSGNVHINNCQFTNNSNYRGHGAAIRYTSENNQLLLLIESCEFSFNGAAKSIVHCDYSTKNSSNHVLLQNSMFIDNQGVPIYIQNATLHLKGKVLFERNIAPDGGAIYSSSSLVIFDDQSDILFCNNFAENQGGTIFLNASRIYFTQNTIVSFIKNSAGSNGGAVYITSTSKVQFGEHSIITFKQNKAGTYGGALCSDDHSKVSFEEKVMVEFKSNSAIEGGAMHLANYCSVSISGNATITFAENNADYGGALSLFNYCSALFTGNSTLVFNDNYALFDGGGLYCTNNITLLFDENANVMFHNNNAKFGGALYTEINSGLSFSGNSSLNFDHNEANIGGAIYFEIACIVSCCGNSTLWFHSNSAVSYGGAMYFETSSNLLFDETSRALFSENNAIFGGVICALVNCSLSVIGSSTVMFTHNNGSRGGAIYSEINVTILFSESSVALFSSNFGNNEGGAINSVLECSISFEGKSSVIFKDNRASSGGGAIYTELHTHTIFTENSNVTFTNNAAQYGGTLKCVSSSNVLFDENSKVVFTNNSATYGGALYSEITNEISFDGNAVVTFMHNTGIAAGGAVATLISCRLSFDSNSVITFGNNIAPFGGAIYSEADADLMFNGDTTVMFKSNEASEKGGAISIFVNSNISCNGNSTIMFASNIAHKGGAIHIGNCNALFQANSKLNFSHNSAAFGGGMYSSSDSQIIARNNTILSFNNNTVTLDGGGIYALHSHIKFENNSFTMFYHNNAARNGGAICLARHFTVAFNSNNTFFSNFAGYQGGAIYGELTESPQSNISSNTSNIYFLNNVAFIGHDIYMHIDASCDERCLNNRVIGLNVTHNFPPLKLMLNDPTICIDENITDYCTNYLLNNIMLGQDIIIDACVLSVFNQSIAADFFINSTNPDHEIDGSKFVSIGSALQGISIIGNRISDQRTLSMLIESIEDSTNIYINLTVELSPCPLGFQHDNATQRCICYNSSDIVSCFGSTSSIKRGYWFGIVDGKATVTVCPNNYCDFICCEPSNGFYQLSPARINQCLSHRSGTACGSCEQGYTLSFDSAHCVSVNKCETGQTVLVVTLSVIYWITLVVVVFVAMYYKVKIGYLYAITYYFSVVDILLGQLLYLSQGLLTTVSIFSSIAKVDPQFLGQLCFVKNMSGIDQQFIHYVHPLAVTIIVGIICLLARMSYKFSSFVSRGIIHVICFLLLLSYTSVATTSLLLLRSLTFHNVDKVYTYLSPDIEYFHNRHLPYGIIAILCSLVIVISLPLLLLLEPFLNHKIDFTRIKPLLDQFQGCYKDRYRYFAAYYMICRLVIILIVIINPSDASMTQFLLVVSSTILALIQLILRPYSSKFLNIFDGVILQIIILVSLIPVVESLDQDLSIVIAFTLVILPLINFLIMEVLVNKEGIKRLTDYFRKKGVYESDTTSNEISMNDFTGITIGNTLRTNATICEM